MSQTVVGYSGEGRARRPIYADQGPASGRASSGPGGSVDPEVTSPLQASVGAGPVERRMVNEAQREAWSAEAAAGRERLVSSHAASHPIRQRPPPAAPPPPEEAELVPSPAQDPPTLEEPREGPTAERVDDIVATGVLDHLDDEPVSPFAKLRDAFRDEWFELIEPGCESCAHAIVCSIRPTIPDAIQLIVENSLPAGIHLAAVRTIDLSCDHFLAAAPAPLVVTATPDPVAITTSERELELLGAVRTHRTIKLAAKAIGMAPGTAGTWLVRMRRRETLPADVAAILDGNRTR